MKKHLEKPLELRICRRNRRDNSVKPGCYYNLPHEEFCAWEWDIYESFPGINVTYSENDCLGLCPCEGISVQIDRKPRIVSDLDEIKQLINQHLTQKSGWGNEKNYS